MNEILRDMINKGKVAAFVDNILVGTETEEEHDKIVEKVLKRLEENSLYVKLEKYMWKVQKIGFLEVIIGPNGIEMEKEKVDGILSWLEPKNVKDVRKFLGLTNYYRRFIKDFAWVARPINMLMRKDVKWQWGKEQQKAFNKLKGIFTTRPVLAASDLDKEFRIEADASNYATGGVLSIKCSDNHFHFQMSKWYSAKWEGDSSIGRLEYTVNYYEYTMSVYSGFWEVKQWVELESGTYY